MSRILVVEDNELNRDLLENILGDQGHEVVMAEDGAVALTKINPDIDLVLLDVMMPGMDGFEVARQIRANETVREIPIIMVTALNSTEDRLRAVEAGANDFIAKPVDEVELRVRMAALLKIKEAQDVQRWYTEMLEEVVEKRTSDLQEALRATQAAHLETIYRLAVAAEYRDEDTAAHIHRVSEYCALLARGLNLPEKEIERLRVASPMHDVGKLGIPDAILLKPGKLTAEEWALMKTHTTIGVRILRGSSSDMLQMGEVIALSHHEKWSGQGYPQGLSGEDIPLPGRITALADVFDALTSERPYKPAFSNEKTLEIMREGRGEHLDPTLYDLFIESWDEVLDIQAHAAGMVDDE